MPLWLILALFLALSGPAQAFVLNLATDGQAIAPVQGRAAVQVDLPSAVLAQRDSLRILDTARGGSLRSLVGWSCVLTMANGTGIMAQALDECGRIYDLPPGGYADFVRQIPPAEATILRMAVAPADMAGTIIIGSHNQLFLGGDLSAVVAAAVWVGGHWYPAAVDEASRIVTLAADAQAEVDAWVEDGTQDLVIRAELEGAPREREWRAARVWVPETERRAQAVAAAQASRDWCVPQARPATIQRTFLICLDTETGELRTRRTNERGDTIDLDSRALPTGTYIEAAVRHPAVTDVRITLQDARGGSQGQAPAPAAHPAEPGPVETTVTHRLFAPRGAGTVEVRTESGAAPVTVTTVDVVDRYVAAFRLGMAVTTPAHHAWEAGTPDASGLAPIVSSGGDIVDGELVVSIVPFPQRGGRDYLVPQPFRLAPQFGLGVVAVNGASIRFSLLQSYYLGAELELAPTFAVSLAGSLRRVARLASGVHVGDLVGASSSIQTIRRFHPGIAVAVEFTPRGLRLKAPAR